MMYFRNRERAEEVTQDIFLKLWQVLPAYDGRAAASTWLYTIARNTCLSALRADGIRKTLPMDSVAEPVAETSSGNELVERIGLERSLAQLPEVQRGEVITLILPAGKACGRRGAYARFA